MEKENINALDEIHKGACMGIDAVHFTLDKVEDCELKKVLENMYDYDDQSYDLVWYRNENPNRY